MARLIDSQSLTVDGPHKLGQMLPNITDGGTLQTPNNSALPGGVAIGTPYSVPSATKLTAQCLLIDVHNLSDVLAQSSGAALNLGKVEILYGGTVRLELAMFGQMLPLLLGADEMVNPMYSANQLFDFGDGFIVPASTGFEIRVTPAIKAPIRWNFEAFGNQSGSRQNQLGKVVTTTTAANQPIISYTPGADWTVQGLVMSASSPGQVCGQVRVDVCGFPLWESPYLGADDSAPVFGDDGDTISIGYGMGVLAIPMEGVEFGEQSQIAAFAHAWDAIGQKFQFAVLGDEASVGSGGGGGNTYSRGRVVNA